MFTRDLLLAVFVHFKAWSNLDLEKDTEDRSYCPTVPMIFSFVLLIISWICIILSVVRRCGKYYAKKNWGKSDPLGSTINKASKSKRDHDCECDSVSCGSCDSDASCGSCDS